MHKRGCISGSFIDSGLWSLILGLLSLSGAAAQLMMGGRRPRYGNWAL